jgi:hypothetical protein
MSNARPNNPALWTKVKAAAKMSSAQKATMAAKKTGPARQSWPVTPSGKRKR